MMMEKSSIRKLAEFIHDLTWEQIPLNNCNQVLIIVHSGIASNEQKYD